MSKPRQYNPRNHHAFNEHLLDRPARKSRMDQLFEQIRQMEQGKKTSSAEIIAEVEPQPAPTREIDKNLGEELRKKSVAEMRLVKVSEKPKVKERSDLTTYQFKLEQEDPLYYIASDNRLSAMLEYARIIDEFIDMMDAVNDQYQYCCTKLSEADREEQDVLHEFEEPKKNAFEGFKLYQLTHYTRLKRRAYKDCAQTLKPLASQSRSMEDAISKLKNISEYLKRVKQTRDNRIYIPRSNLKLPAGDAFRALDPSEQEILRKNLEDFRAQNQKKAG